MTKRVLAIAIGAAVLLGACSSGGAPLAVEEPWAMAPPEAANNAAFFMTITGGESDDTLVSGSTSACGVVEIHESSMTDGVMSMQHLPEGIEVPAGATVTLEPGGLHVMCLDKQAAFAPDDVIALDLQFENAGTLSVNVHVHSDEMGDHDDHDDHEHDDHQGDG